MLPPVNKCELTNLYHSMLEIKFVFNLPRESWGARVDNPSGAAPLPNVNAAAKCLNDAAQKEKKRPLFTLRYH